MLSPCTTSMRVSAAQLTSSATLRGASWARANIWPIGSFTHLVMSLSLIVMLAPYF